MIIVYLGPTLSKSEANTILPNACYKPPVKRGDIFSALPLKPKAIVIIDGFFYQSASVLHKEIMYAISLGVHVFGAASMGAIRAAELKNYGMIGFGKVYSDYCDNILTDDDEIAIYHLDSSMQYKPISDALVNIRYFFDNAIKNSIISSDCAKHFFAKMKKEPVIRRNLKGFLSDTNTEFNKERKILLDWYLKQGMKDIKADDARTVLKVVSSSNFSRGKKFKKPYMTHIIARLYRQSIRDHVINNSLARISAPRAVVENIYNAVYVKLLLNEKKFSINKRRAINLQSNIKIDDRLECIKNKGLFEVMFVTLWILEIIDDLNIRFSSHSADIISLKKSVKKYHSVPIEKSHDMPEIFHVVIKIFIDGMNLQGLGVESKLIDHSIVTNEIVDVLSSSIG